MRAQREMKCSRARAVGRGEMAVGKTLHAGARERERKRGGRRGRCLLTLFEFELGMLPSVVHSRAVAEPWIEFANRTHHSSSFVSLAHAAHPAPSPRPSRTAKSSVIMRRMVLGFGVGCREGEA